MKFMKIPGTYILIFFLNFLAFTSLRAQKTTDEIAREFIGLLEESPKKALEYGNSMGLIKLTDDTVLLYQVNQVTTDRADLGLYYGYERILERKVGNSYKLVRFLLKYQAKPVGLSMFFYKPGEVWLIGATEWDYVLQNELKKMDKLYETMEDKL